jgi:hypothetical protein
MQSALLTADTITAITKANPGVVTSAAHGMANGAYVVMTVNGMWQLNGKVVRVANTTASTWEIEGIDTTLYDTFASGSSQEITFGTSITSATTMTAAGGDFAFIDVTTIHTNQKAQIPGLANPQTFTFENLWDVADAAQIAMKAASDQQAQRAFKFTFGTGGPIVAFTGYVGYTLAPTGNAQDKVTSPAVITAFGTLSSYAS